jgi:predicted TIM-barrel fold metal-dependent hydrolase
MDLLLRDYEPRPMMTVEAHEVLQPRFPVIDAHNHLGDAFISWDDDWLSRPVTELLATMDESGVQAMVDLDGRWGDRLRAEIARYQEPHPDRFAVFSGIDYDNFATDPNFGETEAKRLRESVEIGARGLKVWKTLGLRLRDNQGQLIPIDDPRLDPMWATAGELGVPVLIHIADPVAFFQPLDRFNERWEELHGHPDWHFYPIRPHGDLMHPDFPSFEELMEQFESLLRRHPGTTFIGAHVGCYAENLGCPPGPDRLRHRSPARSPHVPDLLPLPGDPRRILQLRPGSATRRRPLADLRNRPPGCGPEKGLSRERAANRVWVMDDG